jgi:hypothetical protein
MALKAFGWYGYGPFLIKYSCFPIWQFGLDDQTPQLEPNG